MGPGNNIIDTVKRGRIYQCGKKINISYNNRYKRIFSWGGGWPRGLGPP